jgi:phosphohistidine phosphatase
MRHLILLRHAKAEPATDDSSDFERPLTAAGHDGADRISRALLQAGVSADCALVSASARTRETWGHVSAYFPTLRSEFLDSLYLAPAERLLEEAERCGADSVMVIAHNPGIQDLALSLDQRRTPLRDRINMKFPTGGVCIFERATPADQWTLMSFMSPKEVS